MTSSDHATTCARWVQHGDEANISAVYDDTRQCTCTWVRRCDEGATCIETTDNGFGGVAIRDSAAPDKVLEVPGDSWKAFLASVRAEGYAAAVANLRDWDRWATFLATEPDEKLYDAENELAADYLEATRDDVKENGS